MIEYRKYILDNGLTVLTHEAWDTPLATVNLLYAVGSRDEDEERTGFAHLFEHLMFGGTKEVPDFDAVISSYGGENNAFTTCDYTNYYTTLPVEGLQTALHLEADRMQGLDLSQKALEVQQKVVTEEYHQRYMNRPYGDTWLHLRPLCYKRHPYRWPTIGANIRHVSEASLADVQAFHSRYYRPERAILCVAAPQNHDEQLKMILHAWGCNGATPSAAEERHPLSHRDTFQPEPQQEEPRSETLLRHVPADAVHMVWPMCGHDAPLFYASDLVSDILGNGKSSRLYDHLVRKEQLFTDIDACVSGDHEPGLFLLNAHLCPDTTTDQAISAMRREVQQLSSEAPSEYELQKVKNRFETNFRYGQYKAADRALSLCYYTWLGNTSLVDTEPLLYDKVSPSDVLHAAQEIFRPERENILIVRREPSEQQ